MNSISKFSLQSHSGPYEDWPLKSRLLLDGKPTRACLPGYSILHQFQIADGYFLVHDWDCPFEEKTHFTLLSHELRVLSSRALGAPYRSWLLTGFRAIGETQFEATFEGDAWAVHIRPWGIRYLYPRITMHRIQDSERAAAPNP